MKTRIKTVLAGLLLAAGFTFVAASPAHAYPFNICSGVSVICLAEHINGEGLQWRSSLPYATCVGVPSWLNDKTSSLWNKYGWDSSSPPLQLTLYVHNPCRERMYTWGPSAYVLNIGRQNNDRASAVCIGPLGSGFGYCPWG